MTSTPAPARVHPIVGFTHALAGALDKVLVHDPVFLTTEDKRSVLVDLARQQARLEALALKVLAAADLDDVGAQSGATSTGAWLSHTTLADRAEAAGRVTLARTLEEQHPDTAAGLAAGDYSSAHAAVITRALADLPTDLDPDLVVSAEKTMLEEAGHLTPKQLRIVGRHLLEVVAPEAAEARDQDRWDRQDAAAYANARLTTRSLGDGTSQGWFRLPDLQLAILTTALEAIIAPRKHTKPEPDPITGRLPDHATLMGQGLCELLEHLPVHRLGEHGGLAATVVITLDHHTLKTGLGSAALVDGTPVSPGQARRLACGAGIIPAVLGGASGVLDLGREQRLFNKAQRVAMVLRDKGCRAEDCDRPPAWTEAHHLTKPWSEGGKTNLADGILLCGHHHRLAHHPDYTHQRLPNGDLRYHRRT
ncbi:hypothetical protein ACVW00_000328 [Marmoricola sp. URHA0025 HA25]